MTATTERRSALRSALAAAGLAAALAACGEPGPTPIEASGTVEARDARLGFDTPGRLDSLAVEEGDSVRSGQLLARLDREEAEARRARLEAEIDAARARLRELRSGFRDEEVAQAAARAAAARQQMEDARRDLRRTRTLRDAGAVSEESLDRAKTAFGVAREEYESRRQALRMHEEGPRVEQIEAQRARLQAARASLREVRARLENRELRAPFDGIVAVRHRDPGEVVGAGGAVLTVENPDHRWVRIYVREDRIGAVRRGQRAVVTIDTYPDREYGGRVTFIASEAEFTPSDVQTEEERVKLVYRVKVRITGDPRHDLKPGIPADVRLLAPDGEES